MTEEPVSWFLRTRELGDVRVTVYFLTFFLALNVFFLAVSFGVALRTVTFTYCIRWE